MTTPRQSPNSAESPLLKIEDLSRLYPVGGALAKQGKLRALHRVSLELGRGEIVALVGESGSGKSTIGRQVLRLEQPDGGRILLDGDDVLVKEPRRASLRYRGRVQMIFQDPFGSLNPAHSIAHHITRPLLRHGKASRANVRAKMLELLASAGLEPPEDFADRHPHALSGGQRQRVAIARALAPEPDLIIADEPTSMLDVSIRMGVLNLMDRLRRKRGLAFLFITHDLASARYIADRIVVLYAGQIVEQAPSDVLMRAPEHPYTKLLLSAVPRASSSIMTPLSARSGKPVLVDPPPGCAFAPRCPSAMDICRRTDPSPHTLGPSHVSSCHLHDQETVTPVHGANP